ncbi:hypothetical protein SMSP2_02616 [Limihaloglobus sulfuriphilus]|uniref:Ice-binding protein C-terminal domain-containing protein n=1 Tax=Limihaloglobus sulfuriphilus TaxID=1851148 RepID=A0A1Q2MHP8_9BACT|nr:PEP-CTERM sorting domain-containing protein [Limihaloglobus sulfuriphilus]AQQ72235.1 hypothetical protein SMSP2_02616 [Limihaloglobus sulfuriphilus]
MEKYRILVLMLIFGVAALSSAEYVNFVGQSDGSGGRLDGVGDVELGDNWASGSVPYGSDTGLITYANNVWCGDGALEDFGVRLEGGTFVAPNGLAMRGGAFNSGVTTLIEVDTNDWNTVTNVGITGELTFWSQYGEHMILNVLNGSVTADSMFAIYKGTLNLGNGIVHIGNANGTAEYNMLAGGSGQIIIDVIPDTFAVDLDFGTGNTGSFTLGQKTGGVTTGGVWDWFRNNGMISIDGVVTTDPAAYLITQDGLSSSISLVPEPATMMLLGLGSILIRRKR